MEAPAAAANQGRGWLGMFAVLLLLAGGAAGFAYFYLQRDDRPKDLEFGTVDRGKVILSIIEKGELEADRNREVICKVRSSGRGNSVSSSIKWVIDDGSRVRKGDLLMQLDDAGIKDQIKNQEIVVLEKRDLRLNAEKDLEIVRSENLSNLNTAANNVELAKLDLEKYNKGDLEQKRKDVSGRISLAESELMSWKDKSGWSGRMVRKGYVSPSQAQSDEARLRNAEINLDKVKEESRVLSEYESKRFILDYQNKLEQAITALKVAKITAEAKEAQAAAKLQSAISVLNQEESKLEELREDYRNCRIYAPNDGMVVYFIPESSRFGTTTQQATIAVGEGVREGQKLMRIPDLRKMNVRVKIHETLIPRLSADRLERTGFGDSLLAAWLLSDINWTRLTNVYAHPHLVEPFADLEEEIAEYGLPARIKVASMERSLSGHLKMVSPVASATDWMSSDVKVYQCLVAIDEEVEGLKPGMSAEVTIGVEERDNVLRLPVQAVLESGGAKFCYIKNGDKIEKRKVVAGLNNNRYIELLSGSEVKEGDTFVFNARAYAERVNDLQGGSVADAADGILDKQRKGRRNGSSKGAPGGPAAVEGGNPSAGAPAERKELSGSKGAPGSKGGGGGRPQMSEEQRKQSQEFDRRIRAAATPQDRKRLIDETPMPDNVKEMIKQRYRSQGVEIAD